VNTAPFVLLSAGLCYLLSTYGLAAGLSPLFISTLLAKTNMMLCLVASWLSSEYSWVDRLWSVVPVLYAAHFAAADGWQPRSTLTVALTTLWGVRLSYNFARKGGFQFGEQDYRWPALQKLLKQRVGPESFTQLWQLFNLLFIAGYQNFLLLLITLPACVVGAHPSVPLHSLDALATILFLSFFALETVADEQQWLFQQSKRGLLPQQPAMKEDYRRGFRTSGLFAWSRHPAFFAEQALWCSFYLFSVAASGKWLNWSAAGAVLLCILFQGSTEFTEALTAEKYPAYKTYKQRVSRLLPLPPSLSSRKPKTNEKLTLCVNECRS
jgi:steroid 5-alpha reductase family enzyme